MDEELKAMLEGAKSQGANDTDLGKIIDMYEADALKKKDSSQPTVTPPKLASGTPTGSLDGKGFPKIDTNSVAPGLGVQPKVAIAKKEKYPASESAPEPTFLDNVVSTVKSKINKLATGSAQLGADYASVPELLYDAFSMPQNAIADQFDLPSLRTDSEKFKKTVGVKNSVKEYYQAEVIKLRDHAKKVDTQYQDGIYESFKNGDILGGFDQLTNTFIESLPATSSIMLGGAYVKAPQLLATSSMVFGAGKNELLKGENPDMNNNARVVNALATGLAEGAFETIGSGSIGAAARGLIEREGVTRATSILKDGLANFYKSALKKNPLTASITGEGIEEWATQVTQNSIDITTGVKAKDYNVFTGATDAFIGGAFGGSVFGGGIKGIKQIVKIQDRNRVDGNISKIFELQKALSNPELSEETKIDINKGVDALIKQNQSLIQIGVRHVETLHPKLKDKLVSSIDVIADSKNRAKAIKLNTETSSSQKQILLDNLKSEFKTANDFKNSILEGKSTPVDVLPLNEQDKLKRNALKELTAEQNPDGSKNIEIDNAQILERANKNYKASEKLKAENELKEQEKVAESNNGQISNPIDSNGLPKETAENQDASQIKEPVSEVSPITSDTELDIKIERGGIFSGEFLNDYDFLAEGSEHSVYRSKDGKTVIKIGEPHNSNETYKSRVDDALNINRLLGDGSLKVIGTYKSPNGTINPVYSQSFVDGKIATQEQVSEHLINQGLVQTGADTYVINDNGIVREISDTSDNFIINSDGKITSIDAGIREINESELSDEVKTKLNEATPPSNTPTNGNVPLGASNVGENGITEPKSPAKESVPSSVDGGEAKGDAEVVNKKIKLTDKGQAFNVKSKNGKLVVTNEKGEKVSKPTERAVLRKHADNYDFTQGEKAIDRSDFADSPDAYNSEIAKKSNNPAEIAETIIYEQTIDKKGKVIEPTKDHKESIIADGMRKVNPKGFTRFDDRNNITPEIQKNYFDENGRNIDDLAQELSERAGVEITEKDITDFIKKHPKGSKEFYDNAKKDAKNGNILESNDIFDLKTKFEAITGLPANTEFLLKAIEQQNRKSELNSTLDQLSDAELLQKNLEIEQANTEQNGAKEIEQVAEGDIKGENNKGSEQKPEVQGINPEKPAVQEKNALEKAQEIRRAAKAKLVAKRQILSIASNPQQDAQDLYDYHQALVNEAKEHIKIGVESLADFAKAIGEKISISLKNAWQDASGEIDTITKAEDLDYDFDTVDDEVPTQDNKESEKDLEDFRDSWNKEPSSGEINQYDSRNTIEREHGEIRNNQDYEVQKDLARVQIGIKAIEHAKVLFGAEYVEKTLSFIEQANLGPEKKSVAYVLLENEMDARVKEFPDNVGVKKLQDLVRAKSQDFLANSARAMGAGRFRVERFRELAKNGFSEEEFTNAILTTQQIKNKAKIQQLSQVNPDDINSEAESQESDEDFIIEEPKNKRSKAAVKKDISAVLAQMRKDLLKVAKGNVAMSSIPYAAQLQAVAPHIIKLSKLLAELGGMTTKQIINEVYNDIKQVLPNINKTDVSDILKVNSKKKAKPKTESEAKQDSIKEVVKKALIENGFSREITVTINERDTAGELIKDTKGKNVKIKEKRNVLDWKKLAGEAGTIDNIRKNVEESLKGSKYTKAEIQDMKDALEKEYVRLSEDIIEKGLNELVNRNAERKPVNTKSAAKKLAELYNYGLFEKSKDSYEKIINSVLGFNELDQKAFDEMKQIAKGYAVLMDSGLSDTELKDAINTLSRRQARLVATLAFSQADWKFKLAVALSEITNLSTRFKLVNLGNLAENISSGMMARVANNMMDAIANGLKGTKTSNKAIRKQSKINARAKLKGITFEAAESYGDTSSLLLNHSAVEDYFNNATTNKLYHALISTYMAKPVLEGADSYNKILITEANMVRATIKVLQAKGMSNSNALDYVAKSITGESMKEALVKAKLLVEKVNKESGKQLLNDTDSAIKSLAADIVKESLVSGGQISETELKAIYNAAYKSAGKDIGHVSNNWATTQISAKGAQIEKELSDAIKEKKWGVATGVVLEQLFWKNFVSTFIGGGTNWFVKGLQKSANPLSFVSLGKDIMQLKMAGKLDLTTDEGIKGMEESLYRGMNLRSTGATMAMGAIITATIISSMKATGADDEIEKWLKENPWAKKFFDKMVPDAVVLMLAIKDKDYGRYIAKMINVKADFFDDQKNIGKILEKYADGYTQNDNVKISEASGDLGVMIGKRFDFPGPVKAIKDSKQIYKGVVKGEFNKSNYYTSGFLNGFFQGGVVEAFGLRKDPDFIENDFEQKFLKDQAKKKALFELPQLEKDKITVDNKLTRAQSEVNKIKSIKLAQQRNLPYYISQNASLTKEEVAAIDLTGSDESIAEVIKIIEEKKKEYGIEDEE